MSAIQEFTSLLVSKHAKPCKPKLSRVCVLACLKAPSAWWRTPREFCRRDSPSVTTCWQLSYSSQSQSVSART